MIDPTNDRSSHGQEKTEGEISQPEESVSTPRAEYLGKAEGDDVYRITLRGRAQADARRANSSAEPTGRSSRPRARFRLERFSYRFAEEILNANFAIKQEIESILLDPAISVADLSRPYFNKVLRSAFIAKGWEDQPSVFDEPDTPGARMDFLKARVGVEVGFSHASFLGIDLLKFQTASFSALNKIDVGVYIVTTRGCQARLKADCDKNWEGSLTFEKVVRYLPHFKSAIQVPILVLGIDL